jgi:hypothetical protein
MPQRHLATIGAATIGGLGAFVATSIAILLHAALGGSGPFA